MILSTTGTTASKDRKNSHNLRNGKRNLKLSKRLMESLLEPRYAQAAMALDLYVTKELIYSLLDYFLINTLCCFVMNAVV